MDVFVVDTNVAVVANGRNTHADRRCQWTCAQKIISLMKGGIIALDDTGHIINEYKNHLNFPDHPVSFNVPHLYR